MLLISAIFLMLVGMLSLIALLSSFANEDSGAILFFALTIFTFVMSAILFVQVGKLDASQQYYENQTLPYTLTKQDDGSIKWKKTKKDEMVEENKP